MFIIPTFAPGIPGISKDAPLLDPLSFTEISISLLSKSPFLSLFLKLSLVARLAFFQLKHPKPFPPLIFELEQKLLFFFLLFPWQ